MSLGVFILGGTSIYHLLMGGASLVSPASVAKASEGLYAFKLPDDVKFQVPLKAIGAFAVNLGLICAWAAWRGSEEERVAILASLALLFATRAWVRWRHEGALQEALATSTVRNRKHAVINIALAALTLYSAYALTT